MEATTVDHQPERTTDLRAIGLCDGYGGFELGLRLAGVPVESSPTLPPSGSMRNGECLPRQTLAHHINGTGSGSSLHMWGTPTARDDQKSPEAHLAFKKRTGTTGITSLTVQVKAWPTPQARDCKGPTGDNRHTPNLPDLLDLGLPTGTTPTDGPTGSPKADLNPRFVEALMGVPLNWLTPSTPVATASFQRWLRLHSLSLPNDSA